MGTVEIRVEDYTTDGELVDVTTYEFEVGAGEESTLSIPAPAEQATTYGSGNDTIPAPSASSGCRNVWTSVSEGTVYKFYTMKNNLYFCYNKSTKKVSNPKVTYSTTNHDGINDFYGYSSQKAYYNYNNWGSATGYLSKKTWKVIRNVSGGVYTYYPRADIYAHGDGSAYGSWTTS